ncbi:PmbA protein [Rhodovulum bhavnagarense]|uniref:PmbA protein n=1 Tax=Rhodovulum bhavnagarense TaxID=992286 RepID=A0A4R2RFF8_9RHOB|nr:metallopeptidase TldD-related protein [Rhodovulum bhavnagarense]TCP61623.1 PmbA protein [Rhodovulum bhavnagarense]
MSNSIETLTHALLDAATRAGADAADALVTRGASLAIDVRGGALEQAERAEWIDLGLRVMVGRRQACVSSSDTRPETLAEMATRAVAMAREAPEDASVGLADPDQLAHDVDISALELHDPAPEPAPAALENDARCAEAGARANPAISQVQSASAGYTRRALHLAASNGFSGGYERTERSVSCVAITGNGTGMERDWCAETRTFQSDLPDPHEVGRLAAERAVARAGARRPATGAFPVLYDERVASSLIGHLLAAINGQAIMRGASWARNLMGEQVLPETLSLIEEPHRPRIGGSRPFDGEGLPTTRRAWVRDGILQGWVLDLATGRKLGMESTANAARGTSAPPSPAAGNVTLTPGEHTREALLAQMGTGLWVTSLIGSTINPNTGDYSRGAAGFWVENGEVAYPVNECTIAGHLPEMLRRILPADDARDHLSRRVPSLLVEGLTIAGE